MNSEIKKCQNCKSDFTIEPDDFAFYERMKVPAPSWCSACRLQRRFCFRNERALYKRKEAFGGADVISCFSSDKDYKIITQKDWWGDGWDPFEFGRDYDFNKPFFRQFKELMRGIPWPNMTNWNAVNSEYCNYTTDNKNCYLIFGGDYNENCCYGYMNFYCRDSFDLLWVEKLEKSYGCVDTNQCFQVFFCRNSWDCTDCALLYDCVNCHHCFGCVGLRSKSYCFFNEQLSKEEYLQRVSEYSLSKYSNLQKGLRHLQLLKNKFPHRFAELHKCVNCTGDKILNCKNCRNCFDLFGSVEDAKNVVIAGVNIKDIRESDHVGYDGELIYESSSGVHRGVKNVKFSGTIRASQDITYSIALSGCSNCFGCIGLKTKSYCILNKQYSKEEYLALAPRIIEHMNSMPYTDSLERKYQFGDFFPAELSPFAYNETIAQEHFPLSSEEAIARGFKWKEEDERQYEITKKPEELPDDIANVADSIISDIIGCAHAGTGCVDQCTSAFRITPSELQFYKASGICLPRLCPNCRHYERLRMRNPMKLWHRKCECAGAKDGKRGEYRNFGSHAHGAVPCMSEFETSYAPNRPEIIYCEQCYQSEIT